MTGTATPPPNPMPTLNRALSKARARRGDYLVAIAQGLTTPMDLVLAAQADGARALRRILLRTALTAVEGVGPTTADGIIGRLLRFSGASRAPDRLTIGWVVSTHSSGRRITALADAMDNTHRPQPWDGFPFTADPRHDATVDAPHRHVPNWSERA